MINANQSTEENFSAEIFDNLEDRIKQVDEKKKSKVLNVVDCVFGRIERFLILLKHDYFNEVEAAMFLRLSDPEGQGKDTVRNYALRSKKLSFFKIGRTGLIFSRRDLQIFMENQKSKNLYESHY